MSLPKVTIRFDSEEIVPVFNRASWLAEYGPQPPEICVEVDATLHQFEQAGCRLAATGEVSVPQGGSLHCAALREARFIALRVGISGGRVRVSEDAANRILQEASIAERESATRNIGNRERTLKVKQKALEYAMGSGNPWLELVASGGYDVRKAVLDTVVQRFSDAFGETPTIITGKGYAFAPPWISKAARLAPVRQARELRGVFREAGLRRDQSDESV